MPTIKDIAREAGVSHGTVSNVINGRGNVSVEKIRLVWQAAEKLGMGVPTLRDIVSELMKPGRDVRDELSKPILRTDVLEMKDLKPGMIIKGTLRNVIDFGAFVDIGGVDGMDHVSELSWSRIKSPADVVAVGDEVLVKVTEIDEQGRLNLSRRDALIEVEGLTPENTVSDSPRPPRREGGFRRDGGRGQRRD